MTIENSFKSKFGNNLSENVRLSNYSWFNLGGNAEYFFKANDKNQLKEFLELAKKKKLKITIIGAGSNTLFRDNGVRGVVIKLARDFAYHKIIEPNILDAGAAALDRRVANFAKDNNLEILARIVSTSVQGCKADTMRLGPIGASQKALERAKLTIKDIDIVELNEAFASQSLACIKDLQIDPSKVNIDGGALALGHPLGATGARITGKAAQLLRRENKKFALATQCIGLGMGIATIIESV